MELRVKGLQKMRRGTGAQALVRGHRPLVGGHKPTLPPAGYGPV